VLNTRNKAEFMFDSLSAGVFVIKSHDVGDLICRDVAVRNRSSTEDLVIPDAYFFGNVYFSLPRAQFPIVIKPSAIGVLRVCASIQELGTVRDTMAVQDTCSMIFIPFVSTGDAVNLTGNSRCDVPVHTRIYRAGSYWRLRAPFPTPASRLLAVIIEPPDNYTGDVHLDLFDMNGSVIATAESSGDLPLREIVMNLDDVESGMYYVVVRDRQGALASYPVIVVK
jgi:hypothetical protein